MVGIITALTAMSLVVTKSVDFIRNAFDRGTTRAPKWVWNVVALAVGVGYCLGWQLDITAAILEKVPALAEHAGRLQGVAGQALTGILAGAGAGFFHELLDLWSSKAKGATLTPTLPTR